MCVNRLVNFFSIFSCFISSTSFDRCKRSIAYQRSAYFCPSERFFTGIAAVSLSTARCRTILARNGVTVFAVHFIFACLTLHILFFDLMCVKENAIDLNLGSIAFLLENDRDQTIRMLSAKIVPIH